MGFVSFIALFGGAPMMVTRLRRPPWDVRNLRLTHPAGAIVLTVLVAARPRVLIRPSYREPYLCFSHSYVRRSCVSSASASLRFETVGSLGTAGSTIRIEISSPGARLARAHSR